MSSYHKIFCILTPTSKYQEFKIQFRAKEKFHVKHNFFWISRIDFDINSPTLVPSNLPIVLGSACFAFVVDTFNFAWWFIRYFGAYALLYSVCLIFCCGNADFDYGRKWFRTSNTLAFQLQNIYQIKLPFWMSWKTLSVSYMIANLFHLTGLLFVITCIFLCLSHAHSLSPSSIPNSILTDFNFPACFVAKRSILLRLKCKHRKRDRDRQRETLATQNCGHRPLTTPHHHLQRKIPVLQIPYSHAFGVIQ